MDLRSSIPVGVAARDPPPPTTSYLAGDVSCESPELSVAGSADEFAEIPSWVGIGRGGRMWSKSVSVSREEEASILITPR